MIHLKALSRPRMASTGVGTTKDPIATMQFIVNILTAVEGLIGRKNVGGT